MITSQNKIYKAKLDTTDLPKIDETVIHFLGNNSVLDPYLKDIAIERIKESRDYLDIEFGYKIIDSEIISVEKDKIIVNENISFECGNIIAKQLIGSEGIVVFTATLGKNFDNWFQGLFNSGDPLNGYIADLIGSVSVEASVDILEDKIIHELFLVNMKCSNRYSPGYCDWDVSEQHKLFSLLPNNFCGIDLTNSSLMLPIKSVSGIVGYGKTLKKKEYACQICTQENCYLNKMKVML